MHYRKISLTLFFTFLLTIATPLSAFLPATFKLSQVLAQTINARKVEAMRLLQQSLQQFKNGQFETALQSSQLALTIYREIKDRQNEGVALNIVGLAYQGLGNYTKAIEYNQQYLVVAQEIKDQYAEASALLSLGNIYGSQGNYAKAIEYLKQSLMLARTIQSPELQKLTQESLASNQEALQRTQKLNQEAIPQVETNNNPLKQQADSLLQQGIKQIDTKQFEAALQSFRQAFTIYRQLKNRQGEIVALKGEIAALGGLGGTYIAQSDYPKAIEYYQQSLLIAQEIEERRSEASTLAVLGVAFYSLGNYPKALDYLQKSLVIAREIQDRQGESNALVALGNTYNFLGDYPKAIEYLQKSLAIAREMKYLRDEISILGGLGNAYTSLGDYPKAIEYHQQSLSIARDIKEPLGESDALGNMASAYTSLGDYATAIQNYQQALTIVRKIKNRYSEGSILGSLGIVYDSLGDSVKAIEYHQESLAIAREVKDREGEGGALAELGNSYSSLGNYSKAIEYHQQGLAIAREIKARQTEGGILANLGLDYDSLGDYAKAIEYHQQHLAIAQEIKNRQGEGIALGNLGLAYANLNDNPKAITYYQQALAIAQEIKDRPSEERTLNNLGYALFESGNLAAAENILIESIKVKESLRDRKLNDINKVSIFETQKNTYRILQRVYIAQNKIDRALEIAERGRARAFVELLASRISTNNKEVDKSSQASTITDIKTIAKTLNSTLVQYSIIEDDFKIAGKPQTKDSELYIWVIKPTGEVIFRKADLKPLWQKENTTLTKLVTTSRQSIGVRGRGGGIIPSEDTDAPKAKQRLRRLHELLIAPIADLLPKKESEKVVFIPQSELFLVPFPALQDEEGKYLIEKHTILTAPSIQVLDFTHKQRVGNGELGNGEVLVVGNPTMPQVILEPGQPAQQLISLPWAEKEAKDIASILKTEAITGKKATKVAILNKMKQARIIHLATHGLLDNNRGLGSAIALAPSSKDNGLLTAEEILNLKLNADLVVLSACDTGRGRITGDGVIGLSRSLISAGVPSVIVSLWAVDDNSTSFLMTEFYTNLQQKLDKATALRKAMLTTMQKYPEPLNWAAFTLIGESEGS